MNVMTLSFSSQISRKLIALIAPVYYRKNITERASKKYYTILVDMEKQSYVISYWQMSGQMVFIIMLDIQFIPQS